MKIEAWISPNCISRSDERIPCVLLLARVSEVRMSEVDGNERLPVCPERIQAIVRTKVHHKAWDEPGIDIWSLFDKKRLAATVGNTNSESLSVFKPTNRNDANHQAENAFGPIDLDLLDTLPQN